MYWVHVFTFYIFSIILFLGQCGPKNKECNSFRGYRGPEIQQERSIGM